MILIYCVNQQWLEVQFWRWTGRSRPQFPRSPCPCKIPAGWRTASCRARLWRHKWTRFARFRKFYVRTTTFSREILPVKFFKTFKNFKVNPNRYMFLQVCKTFTRQKKTSKLTIKHKLFVSFLDLIWKDATVPGLNSSSLVEICKKDPDGDSPESVSQATEASLWSPPFSSLLTYACWNEQSFS